MIKKKDGEYIIHITHTDLRNDWRIRKEMKAGYLGLNKKINVLGLGIKDEAFKVSSFNDGFEFQNYVPLIKRSLKFPKSLRLAINLIGFYFYVLSTLSKKSIRIIHVHDTAVLPLGWIIKKKYETKLIYDAHELESKKNGQSNLFSVITYTFEKIFWSSIDHLITVSNSISEWYLNKFGYKPNTIILNSPPLENIDTSDNIEYTPREFCNIPDGELLFIHIGLLVPGRGIEVLLDVFSNTKKAHILLMGFGELENNIKSYVKNNHNIHFHKHVENKKLVSFIKGADYGICTIEKISLSDYFALPNKFFEYIFSGLPVLGSNFPDLKFYIEKYNLGYVCNPDYNGVKDAIETIIQDKNKVIIDKDFLRNLSWEAQEEKITDLYKNIK